MSLLVVGVSHHSATVELLERLSVAGDQTPALLAELVATPHVNEAVVLSTCNRVEVYAAVPAFHGGLADIASLLADRVGVDAAALAPHLYVHFDRDAVRHAMRVAAGLDSMVVGEAQILGQLREAYGLAAEHDTAGRVLHELMQQALRVGKRVHAETGIDRAGQSVVSAALGLVEGGVAGKRALVIGAGSMGALALATLARGGAGPLTVANRGADRAQRLAELHGARRADADAIPAAIADVDLVVCATASPEPVLTVELVRAAGPLTIVDLAVPRDVEPAVGQLPGVRLISLSTLDSIAIDEPAAADQRAAESIVDTEVEAFLSFLRGAEVGPTVAALRARADEVVGAELRRLYSRRPELADEQRAEIAHTLHRVVRQLLHSPTVRVRELAAGPGGESYTALVRELFDLSGDLGRAVEITGEAS